MCERATITPTPEAVSAVPAWMLCAPCAECGETAPLGTSVCPTVYLSGQHDPRQIVDACSTCNGFGVVESDWDSFVMVTCPECKGRASYREYHQERLDAIAAHEAIFGPIAGEIIEMGVEHRGEAA